MKKQTNRKIFIHNIIINDLIEKIFPEDKLKSVIEYVNANPDSFLIFKLLAA